MKNKFSAIVFFSLIVLTSCTSTAALVPGQRKIISKNIYTEYMNIADAYYSMEKFDKAIVYYKNCLRDKSFTNSANYKLGLCYVKTSKWSEAEDIFKSLLKKDPENGTLQSSLAYIYCMDNETDKAIELYSKLIQSYPENSSYLENYIAVLIQAEKLDEASAKMGILKEKFPDSSKITTIQEEIKKQTEDNNQSANDSSEVETK